MRDVSDAIPSTRLQQSIIAWRIYVLHISM